MAPGYALHRPFLAQWLIFAIAAVLLTAVVGGALHLQRQHRVADERERLLAASRMLQVSVEQSLVSVNDVLARLSRELSAGGSREGLDARLATLVEAMPSVRTLAVHDLSGAIRNSNRRELIGMNLNFQNRDYFRAPQRHADAQMLFVSPPFRTATGIYTFALTRMIAGPRGEFAGVVVAVIDPKHFEPQLESARYAPDMTASLQHSDGVLFMMRPEPAAGVLGSSLDRPGSMFLRHRESGLPASVFSGTVLATGEDRMIAQREARPPGLKMDKALVIAVSRLSEAILASWRKDALIAVGLLGFGLVAAGLGLYLYQRRVGRLLAKEVEVAAELAESEARFRALFDHMADAVLVHPLPLGHFVDVNPAACQQLGYSREELLRLGPKDIDAPIADDDTPAVLDRLQTEGTARFERLHLARDGRRIPVEIQTSVFDLGGRAHAISIVRDISERKEAERRLRESEAQLRALLEASNESAILIDLDGTIRALNTIGARRLGSTPEEIVGRDIFSLIPPQVAQARRQRVARGVAQGRPDIFEDERNGMRMRHSLMPIRDAAGKVTQIAIFAQDITESTLLRRVDLLLHGFDQQALAGRSLTDVLRYACDHLAQDFGYELVWVGRKLSDGSVHVLYAAGSASDYLQAIREVGVRWDDTPTGHGPAGMTIRTGEAQVFHAADADFAPWARAAARFGLRSILGLPLILRGEVFGVLLLYASDAEAFARGETVARLRHVGARLNVAVEAAERQQQMQLLRLAVETAGSAILVARRDGSIEWTNRALRQMFGYSEGELIGRTPRLFKSGLHDAEHYRLFWQTLLNGETWRGEVVNKRKDGSLVTVMQAVAPVRDLAGEISHFVSVMEDISERKAAEERIRHFAEHDALTDLPNRVLLQARLARLLGDEKRRGRERIGVLYLDIDRFKQINDNFGHDIGDALLRGFAERLRGAVRAEDTVARIGGDEFVVLLPAMQEEMDAEAVARKILAALRTPIDCLGTPLTVGSSIGIAHAPEHATEPAALLKCADVAMYAAKQTGRNAYRVFDAGIATG